MQLIGAISKGSGLHNEDGFGLVEKDGQVVAAWVFDGVTGINAAPLLGVPSEPAWFVEMAGKHLRDVVEGPGDVISVLRALVPRLQHEWSRATRGLQVPPDYDLPAACLTLAKWVAGRWQGLRLGDSFVLSSNDAVTNHPFPPSNLPDLEAELKIAAAARRATGLSDIKALLADFRPRLQANRGNRNLPGSYSILVPDASSLNMPQVIELGTPEEILLCTDGFYRAVDIYGLHDDASLVTACAKAGGLNIVLAAVRETEAADPDCIRFPRFKPADDVTALFLRNHA